MPVDEDMIIECPICLRDIPMSKNVHEGDVVQCPICKAWFKLILENGSWTGVRI
jgi:hypothetical protein